MPTTALEELSDRAEGLLKRDIKNQECVDTLRRLFAALHSALKLRDSVPQPQLSKALISNLLHDSGTEHRQLAMTCSATLQELAPSPSLDDLSVSEIVDNDKSGIDLLPLLLIQGSTKEKLISDLVPHLIRWMSTVGCSVDIQRHSLSALCVILLQHRHLLNADNLNVLCAQLADWLKHASVHQAANPFSRGLFRREGEQRPHVTEIDGTTSKQFFTVLCIGQFYSSDQLLNIHTFASLRCLLVSLKDPQSANQPPATVSCIQQRPLAASRESIKASSAVLFDASLQYCLRIIEQCDRKPKQPQDAEIQLVSLFEAISILNELCTSDPSLVGKVFDDVTGLIDRVTNQQPRLMLILIQFCLNHSNTFPNILKILAWDPRNFVGEFVELLPVFVTAKTAVEMLHCLLDLPCLAAALQLRRIARMTHHQHTQVTGRLLDRFSDPTCKPLFNFILRTRGGVGDTINRLSMLHGILGELCGHPRVDICSDIIPVLLSVFFGTCIKIGNSDIASRLVPVILERAGLLFGSQPHQLQISKTLGDGLMLLFRTHPSILMEQWEEVREYVGNSRNIVDREEFFTHVVWSVGEYLSPSYNVHCTPDVTAKLYETLEILAYEISRARHSANDRDSPVFSARLCSVLMTAVAKLGARLQDLIPRAILCLTKLGQQGSREDASHEALTERAAELISLLQLPNIATLILNPPADLDSAGWHTDGSSLPAILRVTSMHLRHQGHT
ncbi:AP-5 complex subunit zeta-1 [Lamellibrachia satsuma]|nr:AP-5 complex subunit zeta-1 [Lamellibrachia satsuma]